MTVVPRDKIVVPDERQETLPLSPVRNREFLSNHWLEHRMPLEPEWQEQRAAAIASLERLVALWRVQVARVSLYGDETGLEEKFIQPVFECLGWHLKYQAYLNRREPDYALFLTDEALHSALNAGRMGTVNLLDWGRDGLRSGRRARGYAAAATPVTSAQTWKAWIRAA